MQCKASYVAVSKAIFDSIDWDEWAEKPDLQDGAFMTTLYEHRVANTSSYGKLMQGEAPFMCALCPLSADCSAAGQTVESWKPNEGYNGGAAALKGGSAILEFYACDSEACEVNGECREGHTGVKCGVCVNDGNGTYYMSSGVCLPCSQDTVSMFFASTSVAILLVLYLILMSFFTLMSSVEPMNLLSASWKIFLSGMQLNGIALSLPFQFPPGLMDVLVFQDTASSAGLEVIPLDCALMQATSTRSFYTLSVIYGFTPILILPLVSLLVCLCVRHQVKKHRKKLALLKIKMENEKENLDGGNMDEKGWWCLDRICCCIRPFFTPTELGEQIINLEKTVKLWANVRFMDLFVSSQIFLNFMLLPSLTGYAFDLLNCEDFGNTPALVFCLLLYNGCTTSQKTHAQTCAHVTCTQKNSYTLFFFFSFSTTHAPPPPLAAPSTPHT